MGATIQALLEDYAEMAGSLGTDDRRSFEEEEEEEEEEEGKAEYPDDGCERYHATMEYSMSPGCITRSRRLVRHARMRKGGGPRGREWQLGKGRQH